MSNLSNLHIIIAEDDPDDGEVIVESFTKNGSFNTIEWVKNGKELLDYLKDPAISQPDVILTDINMPILSGIEALEEIFKDSTLNQIPAFVFSSTINPIYQEKCKTLGTAGFLVKPFNLKGFDEIPKKIIDAL